MEYDQLKQHHDALKSENDSLKQVIEVERAEKTAIDQMLCKSIPETVQIRRDIVLLQNQIKNLVAQLCQKDDEINRLKEKIASQQAQLEVKPEDQPNSFTPTIPITDF